MILSIYDVMPWQPPTPDNRPGTAPEDVPRKQGTTVTIARLFAKTPVRRNNAKKNKVMAPAASATLCQ